MITKEQAFCYEVASLSFLQTLLYLHFFKYFQRRFKKKYNRYIDLMEDDNTGKYLQKYFS